MLYAKLSIRGHGEFWIEAPLRDNLQAEQWATGLAVGWSLGRTELAEIVDIRLSKHPTEQLYSLDRLREFLNDPS